MENISAAIFSQESIGGGPRYQSLLPPSSFSNAAASSATELSSASLQAQAAASATPACNQEGSAPGTKPPRSKRHPCPWSELHSTKLAAPATIFSLAHVIGSSSSKNNTNAPSNPTCAGEADAPDLVGIMSPGLPVLTMECASVTSTTPSSPSTSTAASSSPNASFINRPTVTQVREFQNKLPHLPDSAELISIAAFYYDCSKTTVALAIAFLQKDAADADADGDSSSSAKSTDDAGGGAFSSSFSSSPSSNANAGGRSTTTESAGDGKEGLEEPYLHIYLCNAGLRSPQLSRREKLPFMPFCLGSLHLGYGGEEVFAVCCGDANTLVFSPIRSKVATKPAGDTGTAAETSASRGLSDLAPIAETSLEIGDGGDGGNGGNGGGGGGGNGGNSGGGVGGNGGGGNGGGGSQRAVSAKHGESSSQKDGGNAGGSGGKDAEAPPHCSASTLSRDGGHLSALYPEFGAVAAPALCMDVWFAEVGGARASVVGCQDGWCRLTYVPGGDNVGGGTEVIEQQVQFRGPITVAKFFTTKAGSSGQHDAVHLLVGCAVELAVVYWDIQCSGLTAPTKLAKSDAYDSITCGIITTLWDGSLELLLGTYGEQVLAYSIETDSPSGKNTVKWAAKLHWRRPFPFPIYSIAKLDLTGDGLDEMVVLTMYGAHVLQQDLVHIHDQIVGMLESFTMAEK